MGITLVGSLFAHSYYFLSDRFLHFERKQEWLCQRVQLIYPHFYLSLSSLVLCSSSISAPNANGTRFLETCVGDCGMLADPSSTPSSIYQRESTSGARLGAGVVQDKANTRETSSVLPPSTTNILTTPPTNTATTTEQSTTTATIRTPTPTTTTTGAVSELNPQGSTLNSADTPRRRRGGIMLGGDLYQQRVRSLQLWR